MKRATCGDLRARQVPFVGSPVAEHGRPTKLAGAPDQRPGGRASRMNAVRVSPRIPRLVPVPLARSRSEVMAPAIGRLRLSTLRVESVSRLIDKAGLGGEPHDGIRRPAPTCSGGVTRLPCTEAANGVSLVL